MGGSSGLGLSPVKRVFGCGDFVIAPVRDPAKLLAQFSVSKADSPVPLRNRLHVYKFDMVDSAGVMKEKVNEGVKVCRRVDALVNNAAQLMMRTVEEGEYLTPSILLNKNGLRTL